jgi:membrane-bound lytic murein transglycosylase D
MRVAAVAAAALVFAAVARPVGGEELLPKPPSLEPAVRFWTRVYTEVDTSQGLLHDAENLDVVYEVIDVPRSLSGREREGRVEQERSRIRAALRTLASGQRTGLSGFEAEVLARWPDGVANDTLRDAIENVRFQLGQANRYREGLVRSGAWRKYIEQVMSDNGVPVELAALPHVESSFNPDAYSRVGAAGLWQFTRSTGRLYLHVDDVLDERLDPYRATVAAARLLRKNHDLTGTWPLAITSYNHGAGGMQAASRVLGTQDIGRIVHEYRSRTFGFASRNFYASFLAALHVDRNSARYFGSLQLDQPVAYERVELPFYSRARSLSRALGLDLDLLRQHNPALRPAVWQGSKFVPRGYALNIPSGSLRGSATQLLAMVPDSERLAVQHRDRYYRVQRGDTLSRVAAKQGVSESALIARNNLRSRHRISPGQVLVLPEAATTVVAWHEPSAPATPAPSLASLGAEPETPPDGGLYAVRAGDTLWSIARRFGTTEREIARANDLDNRHQIQAGQTLRIPGGEQVVASAAETTPPPAARPAPSEAPKSLPVAEAPSKPEAAAAPVEVAAAPAPEPEPAPAEELTEKSAVQLAAAEPPAKPAAVATSESLEPPPLLAAPETGLDAADEASAIELQEGAEVEAEEDETVPEVTAALANEPSAAALPQRSDPSDYEVHEDGRVTVQAAETLGHYAEWLEVGASTLRARNHMRGKQPLVIGRSVKLDFSRVSKEEFERRRLEYHRTLQSDFFDHFAVTGTTQHVLTKGDTLWELAARKYRVPVWLLRQYNPDLDFGALQTGTSMVIPLIEPISHPPEASQGEPDAGEAQALAPTRGRS